MVFNKTIDCKKCDAIYHKKIEIQPDKKTVVRVVCPFCKKSEKIKIDIDNDWSFICYKYLHKINLPLGELLSALKEIEIENINFLIEIEIENIDGGYKESLASGNLFLTSAIEDFKDIYLTQRYNDDVPVFSSEYKYFIVGLIKSVDNNYREMALKEILDTEFKELNEDEVIKIFSETQIVL